MARLYSAGAFHNTTLTSSITTQLSVCAWVTVTSAPASGAQQTILSNGSGAANARNFVLDYRNIGGTLQLELSNGTGSNFGELRAVITLSLNTWHHVVFTADWTQVPWVSTCYVDGVSQTVTNSGAATSGTPSSTSIPTQIAAISGTITWLGRLADVAYYKGAIISALEAAAFFKGTRPNAIRPLSLQGWYPLDGFGGTASEPDLSGKKNSTTTGSTATLAFGPPFAPFTPRWPIGAILTPPPPAQTAVIDQPPYGVSMHKLSFGF